MIGAVSRPRLLIADDHPLILEGIRRVLENDFEIAGLAGDGHTLVAAAGRIQPDMVLLDIAMPLLNGIEAARQLKEVAPRARLIFITQHEERSYIQAAFRAGASAYVTKRSVVTDLRIALKEALAGHFFITRHLLQNMPEVMLNPSRNPGDLFGSSLTPRQREVLQLVAEGKSAKEIAEILKISPKTVEFHKSVIMDELGMRTTAELTRFAIANGIVAT